MGGGTNRVPPQDPLFYPVVCYIPTPILQEGKGIILEGKGWLGLGLGYNIQQGKRVEIDGGGN